jgi:F0F1-type ATP synthase assembly protein I
MPWQIVSKILIWQCVCTAVMALAFFFVSGLQNALAAAAGGAVSVVSGVLFAARSFSVSPQESPTRMMVALARGEALKWVSSILLFMLWIHLFRERFVWVILTFMVCTSVYWFALLWLPLDSESRKD